MAKSQYERRIILMKRLAVVIVVALCVLAGSAQAADTTYDWSGFYLGASAGYAWGNQDWTLQRNQFWGPNGAERSFAPRQFDIGGHLGYQYQWRRLVIGAEGGIYKGPASKDTEISPGFPTMDRWTANIYAIAKGTAKAGFAFNRFLGYVKGGYAGAKVDTKVLFVAPGIRERTSDWHNGWTVGGGVEYALTKHWIIGAEYNYIDLLSQTHSTGPGATGFNAKVDAAVHQALFRLSYKF
jgi:outer membrane immunogenic protein